MVRMMHVKMENKSRAVENLIIGNVEVKYKSNDPENKAFKGPLVEGVNKLVEEITKRVKVLLRSVFTLDAVFLTRVELLE